MIIRMLTIPMLIITRFAMSLTMLLVIILLIISNIMEIHDCPKLGLAPAVVRTGQKLHVNVNYLSTTCLDKHELPLKAISLTSNLSKRETRDKRREARDRRRETRGIGATSCTTQPIIYHSIITCGHYIISHHTVT